MATIQSATLKLWIYSGNYGSKDPSNPTYTLQKDKLPSESGITFDIAELVKDYIEIRFTGDYSTIQQNAWVEYELTREYDDLTESTIIGDFIAYNGYGDFEEGVNPLLSPTLLQSNTTIYVPEGEIARVPILRSTNGTAAVEYYSEGVSLGTETQGMIIDNITADLENYSADTELLNADVTVLTTPVGTGTAESELADKMIIVATDGSTTTVNVNYICEPKFTPYKVTFLNKFGVLQDLWFFKKRTDNLNITKESYKRNTIDIGANDVSYSRYKSTKELYNINSDRSFTMNTGFVVEEFNEVIRQLLMTENAWISENNEVYPIVPKTSSLDYKTVVNDKLINFTVEFEYAYNDTNNIR
jgi:hypothetical protein